MLIRIYIGLTVAINFTKFSLQKGEGIGVSTWNWKSTGMHKFPTFTPPSSQCLRNTALQCGIWVSWDEFTLSPSNVFWDVRTWNVCQRRWNSMSNYFFRWSRVTSLYFIQNIKNQGKKFRAFIVLIRSSFFSCLLSQVAGKREWKIQNFLRPRQTWGKCDIESSNAKCEGSHSVNSMALQWF